MTDADALENNQSLYRESQSLFISTGRRVQTVVRTTLSSHINALLLHGNPGTLNDWKTLIAAMAGQVNIAAIDCPGFGQSPRPGRGAMELNLERLANDAIATADALNWEKPFFIIGHSHGGGVAQIAAGLHPARIAGIVLIGTLGSPAHRSYRLLGLPGAHVVMRLAGRIVQSKALRRLAAWLVARAMGDIYSPHKVSAVALERELEQLVKNPSVLLSMVDVALDQPSQQLLKNAQRILCPTLFIHGQQDALVPASCAATIHEGIVAAGGQSRFWSVPEAGHMLLEFQAAAIADAIVQFMTLHSEQPA